MFINSILTGCEAWSYLSKENIKTLEDCDIQIFKSLFKSHPNTNHVLYFIENGKIPLRHIIAKRKLMYLWHILTREDHEVIKKIYISQQLKPCRNNWFLMISEMKLKYHIQFSDDEIANMSKRKYKKLVNSSVEK